MKFHYFSSSQQIINYSQTLSINSTHFRNITHPNFIMDNSQNASYQAGQAKGQVQEKAGGVMDKASNVAQSAKESIQEAGSQMQAKASGAAEVAKDKLGMNN
ncbi:hypothetical protein LINPERHAP2_LOCUS30385 [Linum perenne]